MLTSSLTFGQPANAEPLRAAITTPSTGQVTSAHPRLIADSARIRQINAQPAQDPFSKALAERVITAADGLRTASRIDFTVSGGRMLGAATELADRTYTLVVAWVLSGDRSYLDLLWRDLDVATRLTSWNPDHMLDGAELTHAAAIAYDWAHGAWNQTQRSQLRSAIITRGLEPSLKIYGLADGAKSPYRYLGNWRDSATNINTVINSGMIIGALAVANDDQSSTVQSVLDGAVRSIRNGLSEYDSDGGFAEGPTYWAYATRFATASLLALKSATGSDYGLAGVGGLSNTAAFALDLRSADDTLYNFGDSSSLPGVVNLPLAGLARLYDTPPLGAAAATDVSGANTRAAQQLVMRDPVWHDAKPATGSTNASYLTGIVTARSSPTSPDATYVAFRSAAGYSAPHQHIDAGDFQLAALGQEWAVELGSEQATYDLTDPARSSARWSYYRTSPIGHNTITVTPTRAGAAQPSATTAGVVSSSPDAFFATANASATFAGTVTALQRGIRLFNSRTEVLVQDEITTDKPVDALWGMHTRARVNISPDGRQAMLSQNGKRLLARIVSGGDAVFTDMPASTLPTSAELEQTANEGVRRLSIWFSAGTGTTTLAVQFTPITLGMDSSVTPPAANVTAMSSWKPLGTATTLDTLSVGSDRLSEFSPQIASYDVAVSDPSALPAVAGTGSGAVSVVQATRATMTARVTVSRDGARPTTYRVRFIVTGDNAVVDGRVSRDPRSRAVDGRPDTAWDPASESSRSLIWRLSEPVPLRSVMITFSTANFAPTSVQLETSSDRSSWSTPIAGSFAGPTATKTFAVGATGLARYIRLTVPRGDAQIAEAVFLRYDASGENPADQAAIPIAVELAGFDPAPDVGAAGQGAAATRWSAADDSGESTTRWLTSDLQIMSISASGVWKAASRGTVRLGAIVTSSSGVSATSAITVVVNDPTRIRIPVSQDSFVAGSTPTTNFGASAIVLNKPATSATLERIGYLAFDLTPIAGREIRSAVLSIHTVIKDSSNVSTARVDLHTVSAAWSQGSITYSSRPASGQTVASILTTKTEQIQTADLTRSLTALVKGQIKTASYALAQDDAGANAVVVSAASKESGRGAYIEVVLAPANADPVPPSRLGSVSFTGVPSTIVAGGTARVSVKPKDSTGGGFTRARVTYSSSDSSIVKVTSSGTVSAIKPGRATLTVKASADGITVSSSIRITVTKS